jgi:hypothetical protein
MKLAAITAPVWLATKQVARSGKPMSVIGRVEVSIP